MLDWIVFGVLFASTPVLLVALWRFLQAPHRSNDTELDARRFADASRARIDLDAGLQTLPGWTEHVRALRLAGYDPPEGPTHERWPALWEQVRADLGSRWTHVGSMGVTPALTAAVEKHLLELQALNRRRSTRT